MVLMLLFCGFRRKKTDRVHVCGASVVKVRHGQVDEASLEKWRASKDG